MKKLIFCLLMTFTSFANANGDYFYFWSDSYKSYLDTDGSVSVLMNLKTSQTKNFDIFVNDKLIAKDYLVIANEITQFPITISKKYTTGDNVTVCALMKDDADFQNVICSKIELVK